MNRYLLFLAVLVPAVFGAASARADDPPSYPLWCFDLHLYCQGAFRDEMPLLQTLATTDPRLFLPEELASVVIDCAAARGRGDTAALQRCAQARPLDHVRTLVLIPPARQRAAGLPRSGARAVNDCAGVHLQLRSDLPLAQELALIKRAFTQAVSDNFRRFLSPIGVPGGPRWPGFTAVSYCAIGGTQPPRRMSSMEWRDIGGGFGNGWEVGEAFPPDYVTHACFQPGLPVVAAAAQPPAPAPVSAGPDQATLDMIGGLKQEASRTCATGMTSYACTESVRQLREFVAATYPTTGVAPSPNDKIPSNPDDTVEESSNENSNPDDPNQNADANSNQTPPKISKR